MARKEKNVKWLKNVKMGALSFKRCVLIAFQVALNLHQWSHFAWMFIKRQSITEINTFAKRWNAHNWIFNSQTKGRFHLDFIRLKYTVRNDPEFIDNRSIFQRDHIDVKLESSLQRVTNKYYTINSRLTVAIRVTQACFWCKVHATIFTRIPQLFAARNLDLIDFTRGKGRNLEILTTYPYMFNKVNPKRIVFSVPKLRYWTNFRECENFRFYNVVVN